MVTQKEYDITKQKIRDIDIKIQLLNKSFQVLEEISGATVGTPSFNISSTSDIRRSLNLSLHIKDSSFEIGTNKKIWLDKYVKVLVGIKDIKTKQYIYTNVGIYLINNPSQNYDATSNTLTLSCVDLMAQLTGARDGNLPNGFDYLIEAGTSIRDAFVAILTTNNFFRFVIEDVSQTVPNDIQVGANGNFYQLMKQLCDILPKYQMYFDVDGVFHYEHIPINEDVSSVADNDIFQNVLKSYTKSTNFEYVKNVVTVIGKTHDIEKYGGVATFDDDGVYNITLAGVSDYDQLYKVGFTTANSSSLPKISINNMITRLIKKENGTTPTLDADTYYVIKWNEEDNYFEFLGDLQPRYTAKDTDNNSDFNIYKLGEIPIVLMGGEYDNIDTDDLVKERAIWELYNYTRLQETVTLTTIPVYWLDVNTVIELTLPNKNSVPVNRRYIINAISTPLGVDSLQTIVISPYYSFYIE